MINSHYVPRLILRKFSDKLSLYNVKTGELKENIPIEHAYAIENFYDDETESKLNLRIESQFGGLLSNIILKKDKTSKYANDVNEFTILLENIFDLIDKKWYNIIVSREV